MKKINLIFAILLTSLITYGQGWVGNSTNNSLVPYNTALGLSPMNIGIGVNLPSEQFHTNGGVRFEGLQRNDTPDRIVVQNATGRLFWRDASTIGSGQAWNLLGNLGTIPANHFVGTRDNQRLVFRTNNTEKATILPNGFIGLGTNNPTEKLTLDSGNIQVNARTFNTSWANPKTIGFAWLNANNSTNDSVLASRFQFGSPHISLGATVHGKTILQSWWGIKIVGNRQSGNIYPFERGDVNGTASLEITSDVNTGARSTLGPILRVRGAVGQIQHLQEWRGSANDTETPFAVVSANGRFGIGTNDPQKSLHIRNGSLMIETPITGNHGVLFRETGTTATDGQWGIQYNNDCNSALKGLNFFRPGIANGIMFLTDNNDVGIGTCTPAQRLHVAGNIQANAALIISDVRYKKEIKNLENQLDVIKKLSGKSYEFKIEEFKNHNFENKLQFGFIAQEIETVLPNIVNTDEKGFKSVNYIEVIPVLVEAIKELNTKVDKQNNAVVENEALKSDIASLKSENEMMKEKFALLEKTISALCENGCEGLKRSNEGVILDKPSLYQSIPNPTDDVALINYALVSEKTQAEIMLMTQDGKLIENFKLETKLGSGSIKVSLGHLTSGTYLYTLVIDGKVFDTKKMQVIK